MSFIFHNVKLVKKKNCCPAMVLNCFCSPSGLAICIYLAVHQDNIASTAKNMYDII